MAEFEGTIADGKVKGNLTLWPGVVGGILSALAILGAAEYLGGDDSNSNTHNPSQLEVVTFTPQDDIECRGLSVRGSGQVIDSTIICVPIEG